MASIGGVLPHSPPHPLQNAMDLQRETCMPYNFGAPPRVNPLAWWLDQTRAFLPQVMKAKEVEAQQQPEAEAGR